MATTAARGVASGHAGGDLVSGRSDAGVSQREDLANFISMITRDETPFMSTIGKTKATAIYHEWQTDELNAPGLSVVTEGTDYIEPAGASVYSGSDSDVLGSPNTFAVTGSNRTRLGNYTQINGKTMAISGTRRAIDQAGVADEYAYQLKKRGTELRRDLEFSLIHSYQTSGQQAGSAASAPGQTFGSARTFGGVQSWINDPDLVAYAGTGAGAVDAANAGNGTHVPTLTAAASRGALSLSDIDQVMQNIYEQGGKANKIMLSPKLRRDFSDLMVTDSGVRRNIDMDGKLRQSVDIYMSDFGDLMVMPNYIMGLTNGTGVNARKDSMALIYDPQWFSIATLRPLQEVEVGQRGDSTIGMMVEECTLEVKNPKGCAAIYNLA